MSYSVARPDAETSIGLSEAPFHGEAVRTEPYSMEFDKTVVLDKLDELNTNVLSQEFPTHLGMIAFAVR